MKSYIFLIFSIVFIFILSNVVSVVESISLVDNEYKCFELFIQKFSIPQTYLDEIYTKNATTGQYNICSSGGYCDINGSLTMFPISGVQSNQQVSVETSDFQCFPNLKIIYITNYNVSESMFYSKISSVNEITFTNITGINQINKLLPGYNKFYISNSILTELDLKYIVNVIDFSYLITIATSTNFVTILTSTPTIPIKTKLLSIYLRNFPDLTEYSSIDTLNFFFKDDFYLTSLSNFSTFGNNQVNVGFFSTIPLPYFVNLNTKSETIFASGTFEKPTSKLDHSNNPSLKYLSLRPGKLFSYGNDNEIPFTGIKGSLNINGGKFNQLPDISKFGSLIIQTSEIGGILPSFNGGGLIYRFDNNKISGTVDESWCNTLLSVANNNLTGDLPSCISCYLQFGSSTYNSFVGNQFNNFDSPPPCTTFKPRVDVLDVNVGKLLFSGKDIGFTCMYGLNGTNLFFPMTCDWTSTGLTTIYNQSFIDVDYYSIVFVENNNISYTFPVTFKQSIIHNVTISGTSLKLNGIHFPTYTNYYPLDITFGNQICTIISNDFYSVECIIPNLPTSSQSSEMLIVVSNTTKITKVFMATTGISNKRCPNDCLSNIKNPICDLTNGICTNGVLCGSSYCFNDGLCDPSTTKCKCLENVWFGDSCEIAYHYINAAKDTPSGTAIFIGFFGDICVNQKVTIGGLPCPITFNSSTEIQCIAPIGLNGIQEAIITQNGIDVKTTYKYTTDNLKCPSECSGNGICNTTNGECLCNKGYSLYDCSYKSIDTPPKTNSSIDQGNGGPILSNQEINFQIYFKSLYEVDINGNTIHEYPLENKWILNSTLNNKYLLSQSIQNNECTILSTIEEITNSKGKQFEFADTTFKLESGSIKFSISISNYSFANNLNTLKLELVSFVDENDQINKDNSCNSKDTEINSNDDSNGLSNFNYIKISKNNKILSGRFINKLLSDGQPTYLNTNIKKDKESILVILSLPHCNQCIIDPDFSVLVDSNYKSCDTSSNKWKLPVIVVCSVVGGTLIVLALFFIIKRNTTLKIHVHKLKRFNNK